MARSVEVIYNDLLPRVKKALGIPEEMVVSTTSFEGMLTYAFAFVTNVVEAIFDSHIVEVDAKMASLKPHDPNWYVDRVKEFQYGYAIDPITGTYNNTELTDEEIEASKLVHYAVVIDSKDLDYLRIKTATEGNNDLEPLPNEVLVALRDYMERIKDAGVTLVIESLEADKLRMSAVIYVDPLLFNQDGTLIIGGDPIRDACKNYLKNLPFNGTFALALMVDEIQAVQGVIVPEIKTAEQTYGNLPFRSLKPIMIPDSGYLRFDEEEDLDLSFELQSPL